MTKEITVDKNNIKTLSGCYYAFFVNGMLALTLGTIMPYILEYYAMGYNEGAMILTFQSMGNLIISFLIGIIITYLGKKNTIVLLSSMIVLGFSGILVFESKIMLLILIFMTGVGRGSVNNISNTVVKDVSKGSSFTLNILHVFFAIGAFLAPFISSLLFNIGLGWKYSVGLLSILAFISVFIFKFMNIDNNKYTRKTEESKKISYGFIKNIDFQISAGILFFYVGIEYSLNGWIVTYFKDTGIMSISLAQRMLSILWIVIIFGRLFTAYISRKIDKENILLTNSIGIMVFFILLMKSTNINIIVICILGLGFCLSGIYPTTLSSIKHTRENVELVIGTTIGIAGLGGIIVPYITGVLADSIGIAGGMLTVATCTIFLFLYSLVNKFRCMSFVRK